MLNVKKLSKVQDILKSDNMLLGYFKSIKGGDYLGSCLRDVEGVVFYAARKRDLKRYLNNEIRLRDIYLNSPSVIVKVKEDDVVKAYPADTFNGGISFWDNYFEDIPDEIKCRVKGILRII